MMTRSRGDEDERLQRTTRGKTVEAQTKPRLGHKDINSLAVLEREKKHYKLWELLGTYIGHDKESI